MEIREVKDGYQGGGGWVQGSREWVLKVEGWYQEVEGLL